MKIALIQQHAVHDREDNVRRGVQAFETAAKNGAELIAFAELGFSRFFPQFTSAPNSQTKAEKIPGSITNRFTQLAQNHGVVTVLNLYETDGINNYDSSPVIDADGRILGVIRMVHIMEGMGFHEKNYYTPGNSIRFVYDTCKGRVGVAICYDRHFPEYMRHLALEEADIVIVPQAGAKGEWPDGIFESELQVASFQNGYFTALVNRVGEEENLNFAGGSFVCDPEGRIIAQAPHDEDFILYAECDMEKVQKSPAKKFFLSDRRPDYYKMMEK
jgi:N-carbamoylputrescine amidase